MEPPLKTPPRNGLEGTRILVGDDEILIALDIAAILSDAGAAVIGPCTSLSHMLKLAKQEQLSGAILDIQLGRATTETVAEALFDRRIPFLFYSGQRLPESIRMRWPECIVVPKPADELTLVKALAALLKNAVRSD
jgi:two-component SAPR family response regulator